jgi:signal transduction histidine kinase
MITGIAMCNKGMATRWLLILVFAILMLASAWPAKAGPRDGLLQYGHVAWRVSDGDIPDSAFALAQTTDGYIWIGTRSGLLRFDGTQFTPIEPQGDARFSADGVFALLAAPDGTLWVGTARGLGQVKNGVFTALSSVKGRVNDLVFGEDGSLWLGRTRAPDGMGGLCHVAGGIATCYGSKTLCPYSNAVAVSAGTVFMAGTENICRFKDNELTNQSVATLDSSVLAGIVGLKGQADGSLLVSFTMTGPGLGLQRLADGHLSKVSIPGIDSETLAGAIVLEDKRGNTWIGTTQGLLRVHDGKTDRIGVIDGLTGSLTQALLQDREGDIWIGTSGGLDRFRQLPVATLLSKDGMAYDRTTVVAALRDGRVLYGSSHGLSIVSGSTISKLDKSDGLPGTAITAIFQSRVNEAVWLGIDTHLVKYENGAFSIESGAEITGPIEAIDEDSQGNLWIDSSVRPPTRLFRKAPGQPLVQVPTPPEALLYRMTIDLGGDLWFATPAKQIFRLHDGVIAQVPSPSPEICVRDLVASEDGSLLVPACEGLFRYSQDQWQSLTVANGLPCNDVFSAAFDSRKQLWLGMRCGYAEISANDVDAWKRDSTHHVTPIVYDVTDGARLQASDFKPLPALAPDGTLWFSNDGPAQMIDPVSVAPNTLPPAVFIEALVADKRTLNITPDMRLPSHVSDIEIKYVGLSYPDVRKVRFRYSLSGVDAKIHEVGTRRSAFFSNLGPGHYVFNVTASNNDGVWNPVGASLAFSIPPRFYQTVWFWVAIVVLVLLLAWYLVTLRIRAVTAGYEVRMRERLAERDRIARELHDTLLQGLQSIVLRFQVVANLMSPEDPARELQLESLARADTVLLDVREKVRDLREADDRPGTLIDDIQLDFEELRGGNGPTLKMIVTGTSRPLAAAIRSELQSIIKEILFNSLQHADASEIVCTVEFGAVRFAATVSDNGKGIPEEVLAAGSRVGHWGLIGIRERAEKIKAVVTIQSSTAGTAVSVALDARYAYISRRPWAFAYNLFGRSSR